MSTTRRSLCAAGLALALVVAWTGGGATSDFPRHPVYNPASKSYFQLFADNRPPQADWSWARRRAQSKFYKGVQGRLAHIRDPETHEFVVNTFNLKDARKDVWIGLRYWCKLHMLQWGNERPFPPSEPGHFRAWHSPWQRDPADRGGSCSMVGSRHTGYVPVYYRTLNGTTLWQGVGAAKFFEFYLVEYPTGGK